MYKTVINMPRIFLCLRNYRLCSSCNVREMLGSESSSTGNNQGDEVPSPEVEGGKSVEPPGIVPG